MPATTDMKYPTLKVMTASILPTISRGFGGMQH